MGPCKCCIEYGSFFKAAEVRRWTPVDMGFHLRGAVPNEKKTVKLQVKVDLKILQHRISQVIQT